MVIDTLDNLANYASLNPLFAQAVDYLQSIDLNTLEVGKVVLKENDLIVAVSQTLPKTKEAAKLETHKDFIDIQIPLSGEEVMGYSPLKDCLPSDASYNAEKDITFYEGLAKDYITFKPGMFAIFFPQDGHAPGISPTGLRKIVVKVRV